MRYPGYVRPVARGAYAALRAALDQLDTEDRATPCQVTPELWFSEDPGDRATAVESCALGCPLVRQCRVFATANKERNGCWGALDFTTRPRGRPRSTEASR